MKHRIFDWDWKGNPPWKAIQKFVQEIDGKPYFYDIQTRSDDLAVLVSNSILSESEVKNLYNEFIK